MKSVEIKSITNESTKLYIPYADIEARTAIKTIPGWKWLDDEKLWQVPFYQNNKLKNIFPEIKIPDDRTSTELILNTLNKKLKNINLYNYQKEGIVFSVKTKNVFIGDEMGLGKSVQALGMAEFYNAKTLIICPANLKLNWANEINKFTHRSYNLIKNWKDFKAHNHYTIINYDIISNLIQVINECKFQLIIIDESHYVKNYKSIRTKAIKQITKKIPMKLLLSGTGIKNREEEFYTQLNILHESVFNNPFAFMKKYCGIEYSPRDKRLYKSLFLKPNPELLHNDISGFYLRRRKYDVLQELPKKIIVEHWVDINKKEYKNLFKKLEKSEGNNFLTLANECKISLAKEKVSHIYELTDYLLEEDPNRKIIIFGFFLESLVTIKNHYQDIATLYTGAMSDKTKTSSVILGPLLPGYISVNISLVFAGLNNLIYTLPLLASGTAFDHILEKPIAFGCV